MKKFLSLSFIMLASLLVLGQSSNLIVFTEQGERFFLILNGIRQNGDFETNVKVTDLIAPSYAVKIYFENNNIPELDKTIYFNEASTEQTYVVKQNKKGEYVMRFMSAVAINQAPPPPHGQSVIVYTTVPAVSTTITHTETTTHANPEGASMAVNINENGVNLNLNIGLNQNSANTSSTTTTYTSTTTTYHPSDPYGHDIPPQQQEVIYVQGYTGNYGCPFPMSAPEFNQVRSSIASKTFEDSKLTIAKQVINAKCITTAHVKEIMLLFDYESTRLDFAKYAYGYTYDVDNYYMLNDAFDFESSIDKLNDHIQSNPIKTPEHATPVYYHGSYPGYSGPMGCAGPMSAEEFQQVRATVESKTFEDSKLTIAKQVINAKCLSTAQVKEIMLMFDFEKTRLDFAKYAYGYTFDLDNYYIMNDAFDFESSIDELNRFINGK